jgi:hypothetical protein
MHMFVLTGRRRAVKKERLVFTVGSFHVPELLGAYESEHKHKDGQQKGEKKHFASQYSPVVGDRLVVVPVVGVERNSGPRAHVTKARWRAGSVVYLRCAPSVWVG